MPSNLVVINGSIEREVPDSFMKPLMTYLEMVKEKTRGPSNHPVGDLAANLVAEADREIFEASELSKVRTVDSPDGCDLTSAVEEVLAGGGPTIVREFDAVSGRDVPVQNESFSQQLANESLHLVAQLMGTLAPVLISDNTASEKPMRSGSPLIETLQAIRLNLASLVRRVDV